MDKLNTQDIPKFQKSILTDRSGHLIDDKEAGFFSPQMLSTGQIDGVAGMIFF